MVSKGAGTFVLWPQYFDAQLTRAQGRRVPRDLAVRDPDASWVEAASRKLGHEPELQSEARHPSLPYERSGRVLVAKSGPKEAMLRAVAQRMRDSQEAREAERAQRTVGRRR